jgi:hypothetical protein
LPGADQADDVRVKDGTAVYMGAGEDVSVAVQPVADGGMRELIAIAGPDAPTEYRIAVTVPEGGFLDPQDDGSITVVGSDGMPMGSFTAPWAKDSTGAPVPTRYQVENDAIVQIVEHTANYPVIADPHYTWGWVTSTAYYSKAETRRLATWSGTVWAVAAICAFFGVETLGAACVGGAVESGLISVQASKAVSEGRCLKIKVPTLEPGTYAGRSGGGYCR